EPGRRGDHRERRSARRRAFAERGRLIDSASSRSPGEVIHLITDIKTPAGADYNPSASGPDMTLTARLRITDLSNGPAQTDAATATDLDFAVPINCNGTPDPALGATCVVNTMADVVMHGSIKEGKSAVLQSFRLRVNDSRPNAVR